MDANGYSDGVWLRSAGAVYGNTFVDIKNGHILTSVYGGNEQTDVGKYVSSFTTPEPGTGTCTVNMVGGTVGVPRTLQQMQAHPVTCYVFGAGKGDQRINFNTWTNVASTKVNISGTARIYGSTFGGGEDGHVMGDAETNIGGTVTIGGTNYTNSGVIIGTTGTSYVDGNVFGGGRGFSGDAQTAGTVGGNVRLNISGGTMLGSVYGGGRLASVGTLFTAPEDNNYGQFVEDVTTGENQKTYGHVTINISGGTIGNTTGNAVSGNVFGGSMGRLTLLDNTINPIWPEMAQVKTATINITGNSTEIKRNVYGGGELGTVRENTYVTIGGTRAANGTITSSGKPTINGSVYGGGYGSDDYNTSTTAEVYWNDDWLHYTYTPMQWAGCVGGNTTVSIAGGQVKQNVYGGGQLASVGIINYQVDSNTQTVNGKPNYLQITKHADITNLGETSEKVYGFGLSWPYEFTYVPCNPAGFKGGKTIVNVSGASIIGTANDDNTGYVFGGGKGKVAFGATDDIAEQRYTEAFCANVRESEVTIGTSDGSQIRTVYGGGEDGHVYENAKVIINSGTIDHSVFGGGKGTSTYTTTLWDQNNAGHSKSNTEPAHSWTAGKVYGNTEVIMNDGNVGWFIYGGGNMASVGKGNFAGGSDDYAVNGYGELPPTGNQKLWTNDDFLNSGKSTVTILGGTVGPTSTSVTEWADDDGIPYGSVFGGSRGLAAATCTLSPRYRYMPDFFLGYVNKSFVNIGGTIENGVANVTTGDGPTIYGSVYGGAQDGHVRNSTEVNILKGSVAGQGSTHDPVGRSGNVFGAGSGIGKYTDGANKYCNNSSGSVTCTTTVDIRGGSISGSVYGGGALASVGPPNTGALNGQGFNELNTLDAYTQRPDAFSSYKEHGSLSYNKVNIEGGAVGGSVYGASRGPSTTFLTSAFTGGVSTTATAANYYNPTRYATTLWTEVNVKGGTITGDVYGGGEGGIVKESTEVRLTGGTIAQDVFGGGKGSSGENGIAANVGGDVLVDLNNVAQTAKGCIILGNVFGANNVNGTPEGHVKVHVHATQNKDLANIETKSTETGVYDVTGVFGGGKKADYVPTDNVQSTEVIIEGCDLTSIEDVYGGGYGAATPGTNVLIKGTKIIDNVFGGGYGASTDDFNNPGANVGYLTPTEQGKQGPAYDLGEGKAVVQLMAGTVNHVYGGSNSLGDIRGGSNVTSVARGYGDVSPNCCTELSVQEIYGGGKQADMFGEAEIVLGCMPNDWIGAIYGGAANADVKNDVSLTLTSGKFGRVFGGNKSGGNIEGYIEVNIEENPDCSTPIIIGELYGGGDAAPYTVPAKYFTENNPNYQSPRVNVRSFTSIGNVYGGGYGSAATVTGNPMVNINEVILKKADGSDATNGYKVEDESEGALPSFIDGVNVKLYPHEAGKMGVIGKVFGGGNAAKVIGNTYVNIGTTAEEGFESLRAADGTLPTKPVVGADIRGNVYGGGNAAEVTGKTNVVIGKEKVE